MQTTAGRSLRGGGLESYRGWAEFFGGRIRKLIGGGVFSRGGFCPAALGGVLIVFNHWGQCPAALKGVLIVFKHWGQYPCFIILYITYVH